MDDKDYMQMALELAAKGRGFTSPNPMVGAVVVKDGRVVGSGYHRRVGGPHAEVNALADAGDAAKGATLYVTLEPCNHTGRTPPCTESIIKAGIKRVVVAMPDPNIDVIGGGNGYLQQQGIEIVSGVCEKQAKRLNEVFIKFATTHLPFVILKCAATLDGRIATRSGDSKWVTGESSREFVHRLRHAVDGILVGVDTVKMDNPSLTTRIKDGNGLDPVRIILDTHLSTPLDAKVLLQESDADTLIVTAESVPDSKKEAARQSGAKVITCPLRDERIDLQTLMNKFGAMGLTSILIEGGSRVIASALKAGIVDKILFFYAPKILGGDDGIPICRGTGPELMKDSLEVADINFHRFDDDILIEGYIEKS